MPFATASDGVKLAYEIAGKGPAIIFVHELAGTLHSFDLQIAALKPRFRCIVFNARGYPPSEVRRPMPNPIRRTLPPPISARCSTRRARGTRM